MIQRFGVVFLFFSVFLQSFVEKSLFCNGGFRSSSVFGRNCFLWFLSSFRRSFGLFWGFSFFWCFSFFRGFSFLWCFCRCFTFLRFSCFLRFCRFFSFCCFFFNLLFFCWRLPFSSSDFFFPFAFPENFCFAHRNFKEFLKD